LKALGRKCGFPIVPLWAVAGGILGGRPFATAEQKRAAYIHRISPKARALFPFREKKKLRAHYQKAAQCHRRKVKRCRGGKKKKFRHTEDAGGGGPRHASICHDRGKKKTVGNNVIYRSLVARYRVRVKFI